MIAKIFGNIIKKSPSAVLVRTGGIGFEVLISNKTSEKIPGEGSEVELDTYTHVREDEIKLIGFFDENEKEIFLKILGVSGISIKIALSALSIYDAGELKRIITDREVDLVRRIPGIGKKLAERMILELKDRLEIEDRMDSLSPALAENDKIYEVRQALVTLGYSSREINKALLKIKPEMIKNEKIEDILKAVLREV